VLVACFVSCAFVTLVFFCLLYPSMHQLHQIRGMVAELR
jgi:hypothetical protein